MDEMNEQKIIEIEENNHEVTKQLQHQFEINHLLVESVKSLKKTMIILMVICLLISSVSFIIAIVALSKKNSNSTIVYQQESGNPITTKEEIELTEVIEKISPTIVEVYTELVVYNTFYGNYVSEGAGSGIIYSSDGYILTNNHVIDGANTIKVKLNNGKDYEATLVATDMNTDVAVIKIDEKDLPHVVLSDSNNIKVGQGCIAIGNPLGNLGGTVTTGIISALSRKVKVENIPMELMQMTAAVSPGNSGGGLFDYSGCLIGMVNAKSSSVDSEGIGFAIPVNTVKNIAEQLITKGYVDGRPMLGVRVTSVETVQQAWNLGVSQFGIYVNEVVEKSTADAGLKEGDLIVGLNDYTIDSLSSFQTALFSFSAGDKVTLTVLRGKEQVKITLTLVQKK